MAEQLQIFKSAHSEVITFLGSCCCVEEIPSYRPISSILWNRLLIFFFFLILTKVTFGYRYKLVFCSKVFYSMLFFMKIKMNTDHLLSITL